MEGLMCLNETLMAHYRIQSIGGYSLDFHSHQEYEIYVFHEGSCRYLIHNHIYDLEPGDILIMDGMTLHKANVNLEKAYVRSVVHFSPHWIKSLLTEMDSMYLLEVFQVLHHCLIRTKENDEFKRLEDVICRLAEIKGNSEPNDHHSETEMKVMLLQILIHVYKLGKMTAIKVPNKKGDKAEHAEKIADFIQENYMKKVTIQSIAEALNLSKSYVAHVFKEMTGFTVMEYLMASRLTQVKYLLETEPDMPINDIAFKTGFESASRFSRYFHEKVGVTAREYRRLRIGNK
ncbi:AraC family transcriptional regulator [Metabacillus niabensis]|uniref:AraC family transcriptional regulator n=1 Tax=Metabacillus niabensis TaxID=324854 RepID=UPI001CFA028E|nr:AraC family transcriptional regulator [Metabacillus niabensis]